MTTQTQAGAVIFVEDVPLVARFYEQLAGMRPVVSEDDHVVLESGPIQLVIHAIPKHLRGPASANVEPREDGCVKLFFGVPSIAAVREKATRLGGRLWAKDKEWEARGFRACDGIDPEGNVVQFREDAP